MRSFLLSGMIALTAVMSWAQEPHADSTKVYPIKEIVITATRSDILRLDAPVAAEIFDREALQSAAGSTVADLLERSSGLFIRDQGADGALKTATIRGTSSEQVLVLMDGTRMNSFENGLVNLSYVPLNDVERIEVVHGGSSALYGADALGGVINIITRQAGAGLAIRTEAAAGSYGYQRMLAEGQSRLGGLGLLAGYSAERGRNDFPVSGTDPLLSPEAFPNRSNADFARRQLYLHGNITPDLQSGIIFSAHLVSASLGVPGPVTSTSDARQGDDDLHFSLNYTDLHIRDAELTIRNSFHYMLESYDDPGFLYRTFYKNLHVAVNPQATITLAQGERIIVGAEYAHGTLHSADFSSMVQRDQKSFYISNESQFTFERALFDRLSLFQTVRYDDISDVGYAVTPRFGANVRIARSPETRLHTSFGQNFRAPTFNDLYYPGFSNPSLKPELSTSFDAGVTLSLPPFPRQSVDVTYYYLTTENRILLDAAFVPHNIGRVISRGIEVTCGASIFDNALDVGLSYTLTDARKKNSDYPGDSTYNKQVPYMPRDILNLSASGHLGPLTLSFNHNFVARRFLTPDDASALPLYHLTNVIASIRQQVGSWDMTVRGEVNNVFDRRYEVFQFYPMPGRNFRLTVGVGY